MNKISGIYIITNNITGKRYIGKSNDVMRRFLEHKSCARNLHTDEMYVDMNLYGVENFSFDILESCEPENLDEAEIRNISKYKPEYNKNLGGKGNLGHSVSDEAKRIISQKAKEQWDSLSEDKKNFIIQNNLKGPKVGHDVSDETREKLRKANVGKKQSDETKEKRKLTMLEKKKNGWVKDGSGTYKKVVCVETGDTFESVKAAAEWLDVSPGRISDVLCGRRNKVHGYHFQYCKV